MGPDEDEPRTVMEDRPDEDDPWSTPAKDAQWLREHGVNLNPAGHLPAGVCYWDMTPEQRAGVANAILVQHTNSPKEGPEMYDMDDMGALDQAAALETARRRWALENVYGGMADSPSTEMPTDQELLDVFGGRDRPFPLAGAKTRQERKALLLLGQYKPVGKDFPDKEERIRRARLMNRINGVMGGWGAGTDPATEAAATVEELERLRDWTEARLAHLTRFPAEPELSDGPCVVTFARRHRGRDYSYAALRVPSGPRAGTWVVTGPSSPAYLSWQELMVWLEKGTPSGQPVKVAYVALWDVSAS